MGEQPDRNLGLELVRATEAAALAAVRLAGRSQKEAGDQAAVDAMRLLLSSVRMDEVIVIGEAENLQAIARAKGIRVEEVTVVALNRPRNAEKIAAIHEAGGGSGSLATVMWHLLRNQA